MKKFTIILTVLIAITIKTNAQIPNSGFENWVTVGNSFEPTSWFSFYSQMDSTGSYNPIIKSNDHYPANIGNYSVKISNDTARWNSGIAPGYFLGWGVLFSTHLNDKPLFPVTGHPIALCGYYKFLPQNGDTMGIAFHFYLNGIEITTGNFHSNVAAPNWTPFKVYVSDTLYSSIDSARISFEACVEPKDGHGGPRGNSILYIDNLSFDNLITSAPEQVVNNTLFNLYPNPASDIVSLNIDNTNNAEFTLNIYNVIGTLVKSEILKQNQQKINIVNLNNGIYMVEIKSKEFSKKQKLIIQK